MSDLTGCDLDLNDASLNTDDDDIDAFVMFADVAGDPRAVWEREVELEEWTRALRHRDR